MKWITYLALAQAVAVFAGLEAFAGGESEPQFLPGGIVYPEYNSEGLSNPATLSRDEASLARVMVTPNIFGNINQVLDLDYTLTQPNFGFDAGYNLSDTEPAGAPNTPFVHLIHGGAGYRLDSVGVGVAYESQVAGSTNASDFKIGLAYSIGKSRLALVMDNLTGAPNAAIGIGVHEEGIYSMEFDVTLPPFSAGLGSTGAVYAGTLAASIQAKSFGVGFGTSYGYALGVGATGGTSSAMAPLGTSGAGFFQIPLGFSHEFSLLYKFTRTTTVSLRLDNNNYVTLAFTFKI